METNGINEAVWLNKQIISKESSSSIQYQEGLQAHIGKKRKLLLTDQDAEESSLLRIEATYDQRCESLQHNSPTTIRSSETHQHKEITMYESSSTHTVSSYNESITTETYSSRLHCSQDIMGNLFGSEESDDETSKPVEKPKKKKKGSRRRHEKERREKRDLIEASSSSSSSSSSENNSKRKDPRIGNRYQCDMSILDRREVDRVEFIGENIWDPSKVSEERVNKFLSQSISRPSVNQFDFDPFIEYIPATSIIAQDKLLAQLFKFGYNFDRTSKYLVDNKLEYTDRGFSVRLSQWKSNDIKVFEKSLKKMFELEGKFDLEDTKIAMPWKSMKQICEFYYAWKHTKRFQSWKDESNCPVEKKRDRGNKLRQLTNVNYNDQTSLVLRNLDNRNSHRINRKPWEDSKAIQTSNEGDYMAFTISVNAAIIDLESERKNFLSKYITKKNGRTDKFFLEYS